MKGFLREAFALACNAVQSIENAYDRCNVFLWRALMDDDFLSIDKHAFESPFVRKIAGFCDTGIGKLRENAYDLSIGGRGGDLYPKPSNSGSMIKALASVLTAASKTGLGNPATVTASAIIAGVAAFAYANGSAHAMPDAIVTWQTSRTAAPDGPRL